MRLKIIMLYTAFLPFFLSQCEKDHDHMPQQEATFRVTVQNVMEPKDFFASGVFNTPVGESDAGPALPGHSYEFTFHAGPGMMLSFETMYGKSNDLFYAPSGAGIELFDGLTPVTGNITSQVMLWDAGTEVNEMPGTGPHQPANGGPNTGMDENGVVQTIDMVNDGFTYPAVDQNIKVTLTNDGGSMFTLTIENLAGSSTPLAPGTWVVHTMPDPIFTAGVADRGQGLEAAAEDGNPSMLADYLSMHSGYVSPIAPGVYVVQHNGSKPIFTDGQPDYGDGLEQLAESGDPSMLAMSLPGKRGVISSGVYNTPLGASGPGPLLPGQTYEFTFDAHEGDYFNFASMLGNSNDLFFSTRDKGIALWSDGVALSGDITSWVDLWDAGTEVNEYPGAGINQPARSGGGVDENGNVMKVDDGFTYPAVNQIIKITITPE